MSNTGRPGTVWLCHKCKTKHTSSMPNEFRPGPDGWPATAVATRATIRYIDTYYDPYGHGTGGILKKNELSSLKKFLLWRVRHSGHKVEILMTGQPWPKGSENYRDEAFLEKDVNSVL